MPELVLYGVVSAEVPKYWPRVCGWVAKACERSRGRYHPTDVYKAVLAREWQLWVGLQEGKVVACGVTEIIRYPGKKYARIIMGGGAEPRRWKPLVDGIEAWAAEMGCNGVESSARSGWWRLLYRGLRGWKNTHCFLEKEF